MQRSSLFLWISCGKLSEESPGFPRVNAKRAVNNEQAMYIPFVGNLAVSHPPRTLPLQRLGLAGATAVYTDQGPIPAGMLIPGDLLLRRGRGGPGLLRDLEIELTLEPLVRIAPDALGRARPDDFALVPPDQRLVLRSAAGAPREGTFAARDLIDGQNVRWFEPQEPVQVVRLILESPQIVHAGGLELDVD